MSNDYKRSKHWFQEDDIELVPENSTVVSYICVEILCGLSVYICF